MRKLLAALRFYSAVFNEYSPVAQGFGATHIVSDRYHSIAAFVMQHIENFYKVAQTFIILPNRRLVK